jgi:hypothetical protein
MEQILTERSDGSYGAPLLHGMLTASVVGPEPVPIDWILQVVLSPPRETWEPLLATEYGFQGIAPILATSDSDEWDEDLPNPIGGLTPSELCDRLKNSV